MNKLVDFDKIGYVAATFPVDDTTIAALKESYLNASTGNVDVNGKQLAVRMGTDGKVGFGASTPTKADALLGIIMAYEMDGYASVQIYGGADEVPTKSAITTGPQALVVNDKGQIEVLSEATEINYKTVAKESKAENLFASIIL